MPKVIETVFYSGDDRLTLSRVENRGQITINEKTITLRLDDLDDLIDELRLIRNAVRDYDQPF